MNDPSMFRQKNSYMTVIFAIAIMYEKWKEKGVELCRINCIVDKHLHGQGEQSHARGSVRIYNTAMDFARGVATLVVTATLLYTNIVAVID